MKQNKILVSGSLVFDTIFDLHTAISDQIVVEDGVLGKQNLMFTAKEKQVYFGGTAGNIAYGLGLLHQSPFVFSAVGKDFDEYEKYLRKNKAVLRVHKDKETFGATFYGITDTNKEQFGIFQGGAYNKNIDSLSLAKCLSKTELQSVKCAIFAPGTAKSMLKQALELRKINSSAFILFDPGQMLAIDFSSKLLTDALKVSDMLIVNDTEYNFIKKNFNLDTEKIFALGVTYILETKGENGSTLYELENGCVRETEIKASKVSKVVDPTGAGDAYRAGILYGILHDKDIEESMILASRLGAECVKNKGGQTYKLKK